MYKYSVIPTRLAAALLLKHGEISVGEIRALPLVEDEKSVSAITELLARRFQVIRFGRWASDAPPTRFDEVIRLVEPPDIGRNSSEKRLQRTASIASL